MCGAHLSLFIWFNLFYSDIFALIHRDVNETLRSETETFDFKSESRPRPSKIFSRLRPSILGPTPRPRCSGLSSSSVEA